MSKRSGGAGETLRTVVYAVLIAIVVRTFAYEPFNIPSGSMVPTLLVGDYLFVSKFSYGYSRYSLPFSPPLFSGRVLAEPPRRGDVAVFKTPADNATDYIKRVIGLPGDRVQMRQGRLYINGIKVERRRLGAFSYFDRERNAIIRLTQYEEILPGGVRHPILEASDRERLDNTREFTVPEGHYFMMGDNRDNSIDSRARVGFVPLENFIGRAEMIFYSTDGSARLWEVWKWFPAIRYGRLFGAIE
ncbi:signal peptidase I [Roseospirillum parvum]|uniref:Signal peptidase I n=1 Tax=Roseospirillum parvum TaxID=83401 RepID=A0A1G7YLL2_9PROT|nr:signal peptidase I [Roseospirillum parvum]SDG97284.1 signal peptidase I [Roseospirillum parvum]